MTLNYCYVFYQVALSQNITEAARRMHISQPSVSRSISLLEAELGKKLFIRSKNGVMFTEDGKLFFEYVSKGMKWLNKAELEIQETDKQGETITLGVSQLSIRTILPPILQEFSSSHPSVNLIIQTASSINTVDTLSDDLIDVAIVPDPVDTKPDIETIKLMDISNSLIAGQKYNYLQGRTIKLEELNHYPFIALSQGTAGRRWLNHLFIENTLEISPTIEVPTSDLIVPLAKNNLGLGIVADIFIQNELSSGEIIKLSIDAELPPRSFILCYKKNKEQNPRRKIGTCEKRRVHFIVAQLLGPVCGEYHLFYDLQINYLIENAEKKRPQIIEKARSFFTFALKLSDKEQNLIPREHQRIN